MGLGPVPTIRDPHVRPMVGKKEKAKMNRVQEFERLMELLVGGNYRVWWVEWRGDESAELIFTVPGQVKQKELTLSALLEYLAKRYGVTSAHPQVVQIVEGFQS